MILLISSKLNEEYNFMIYLFPQNLISKIISFLIAWEEIVKFARIKNNSFSRILKKKIMNQIRGFLFVKYNVLLSILKMYLYLKKFFIQIYYESWLRSSFLFSS